MCVWREAKLITPKKERVNKEVTKKNSNKCFEQTYKKPEYKTLLALIRSPISV